MESNIDMNGFTITNLKRSVNSSDAVRRDELSPVLLDGTSIINAVSEAEAAADAAQTAAATATAAAASIGTLGLQNSNAVTITGGTIVGITDLTITDGGTGASTAAGARSNLGVIIGTNVQAWDADLDTYATKTPPSGAVVGDTDSQTLTNKTISASSNTISNLTTSLFAASVFDNDATLSANSATRIASQQALKTYIDATALGLKYKDPVRVATLVTGTLASAYENGDVIDGITLTTNDRILIKNQSTQTENGVYTVNASGAPTRALDVDSAGEMASATVLVTAGTQSNSTWTCQQSSGITLGSTNLTFAQISGSNTYTAGLGLSLVGNQFSVTDPELTALAGLTSASNQLPYFTGSGTAATTQFTVYGRTLVASGNAGNARNNLGLGSGGLLVTDTDGTLAANSDSNVATQKATKTYIDSHSVGIGPQVSIASAGTVNLGVAWPSRNILITGTTEISHMQGLAGQDYYLTFASAVNIHVQFDLLTPINSGNDMRMNAYGYSGKDKVHVTFNTTNVAEVDEYFPGGLMKTVGIAPGIVRTYIGMDQNTNFPSFALLEQDNTGSGGTITSKLICKSVLMGDPGDTTEIGIAGAAGTAASPVAFTGFQPLNFIYTWEPYLAFNNGSSPSDVSYSSRNSQIAQGQTETPTGTGSTPRGGYISFQAQRTKRTAGDMGPPDVVSIVGGDATGVGGGSLINLGRASWEDSGNFRSGYVYFSGADIYNFNSQWLLTNNIAIGNYVAAASDMSSVAYPYEVIRAYNAFSEGFDTGYEVSNARKVHYTVTGSARTPRWAESIVDGSIYPYTDNSITLGVKTTNTWKSVYTQEVGLSTASVGSLPTAVGRKGTIRSVSDLSNFASRGSTAAGGGSTVGVVVSNDTNWIVL